MSHTYAPSHTTAQTIPHAHAIAQAPTPAHPARALTCVTSKWLMPLDIRPSHSLPLCACVTPMHLRCSFAIHEEPLGKIRGHDIELYLDVERPYPAVLRRPPCQESLENRKEIEKNMNKILDMDAIRKIGHNEIVEITTLVLITFHDGKSRLCGDFRALNNYTKADRYPIPRIPHTLKKLEKGKYISKMDFMKGFHQNVFKPKSIKLLRIICHMGIYEYTRMLFGIKMHQPTSKG
ncbi:hypothetical protein O181_011028 [Austropuccinia psidii MF-1]|uniref:Reverse transcriptase domain-containing protein n=1 Tax=Austropuccinia psidii MF-1 TaxID=1389203 RepID=A0A9Q3BUH3_9BASI|nr:hypothetical protein [Austropuccinia psidii MF-1]